MTACWLCGASGAGVVWRENGYAAVACRCGMRFVDPAPGPGVVDPTDDGHPRAFYRLPARWKARWVAKGRRRARLLEVGCGEGDFLAAARAAGHEVTGVEPSPVRAAAARKRGIPVIEALLDDVPAPERGWDIVWHCDLLSHFDDPLAALGRMRSLLGAGGELACEVGVLGDLDPRWYRRIGRVGLPQHRWLYAERTLERLFRQAGLRIVERRRFGLAPAVLVENALRGLARRLRPAPRPPVSAAAPPPRSAKAHLDHFLRYRVGAWSPAVGPATLLLRLVPA